MKIHYSDMKSLIGTNVKFNDNVKYWETDFDAGMKARITEVYLYGPKMWALRLYFNQYEEYNKGLMEANYYDKNGVPCETWEQQDHYKKDLETGLTLYVGLDDNNEAELPFDILGKTTDW